MDGIIIVNKPVGMTSFDVIRVARKKLGIRKIGHLGTLDPAASGVLVLALNQATKFVEFLMKADKVYEAEIFLGAESTTFDRDGEIKPVSDIKKVGLKEIEKVLAEFIGEIEQIPPKFSAKKIKGKRACDLMRSGKDVDLKPVKIKIHSINVLDFKWPKLRLKVSCGSGTYLRSLADDLGKKLKVGGYLSALERKSVAHFAIEGAIELEAIEKDKIRPLSEMILAYPRIDLSKIVYERLKNGLPIAVPSNWEDDKSIVFVAAFCEGDFKGILERNDAILKFKKQIN